ncbi:MAG TPA: CHC2 zinc finger domain-containing protein [Bryobacteraceae bacterium]|jgi:DNA primase|nr:CHC2 zinc finger domain-containing protein [Bryobacteraceae bacterium]
MQDNWVDFKAIKAAVTMEMILGRYRVNWLRKKDDELRGRCPIHQGEGQSTLHVSLTKNVFHCFSCRARGNVLDFVAAMEKCSVRDAGVKLTEWFSLTSQAPPTETPAAMPSRGVITEKTPNPPLPFQLKGVDHAHVYLRERGITAEIAQTFGVGYFGGRGSMQGRIVIPIHNERGDLVAYAGRSIDGSEPRYKLPAGFHKSQELFNLHRAIGESSEQKRVVVVEGFFDCMKISAAGFPCVALMGSSLSKQQEELLASHFKNVCLMFDGDETGRAATDECLLRLGRRIWVWAVMLPDGKQPDQLSSDELSELLEKTTHSP